MSFWDSYHRLYYRFLEISLTYEDLFFDVIGELKPLPNNKILDAGCGPGYFSFRLLKNNLDVYSLDYSKTALNYLKGKNRNAKIVYSDLRNRLPFEDSFFDRIICINTLYTLKNHEINFAMKEFHRVLKEGGRLIVVDPKKSFSNRKIFFSDIKIHYEKLGLRNSFIFIFKNLPLYLKLLIYNIIIDIKSLAKRYHFQTEESYKNIVNANGFKLSHVAKVYAQQCIMISSKG